MEYILNNTIYNINEKLGPNKTGIKAIHFRMDAGKSADPMHFPLFIVQIGLRPNLNLAHWTL